ncbi:hypothetical protein TNCV_4736071 [Trichonephila clavipes]|nr:hypothetical protein TNCV_4736071 [Trichonephila clavipes]
MLGLGNTRPLPGHSSIGSINTRNKTSSWRASTHLGVQQGRQCAGHLAKTRHGAYLEYTQNIVLQHQGEDPTEEKEKGDEKKRVENREGSLGYPGFVKPVFTKDSKPLGKRKRSLGHLGSVKPVLT